MRTHYQNLQVAENASPEVIKGAYKYLSQKWHPDKNPDQLDKAERNSRIINEAYAVLSDPVLRKEHDAKIKEHRRQEAVEAAQRVAQEVAEAARSAAEEAARQTALQAEEVARRAAQQAEFTARRAAQDADWSARAAAQEAEFAAARRAASTADDRHAQSASYRPENSYQPNAREQRQRSSTQTFSKVERLELLIFGIVALTLFGLMVSSGNMSWPSAVIFALVLALPIGFVVMVLINTVIRVVGMFRGN